MKVSAMYGTSPITVVGRGWGMSHDSPTLKFMKSRVHTNIFTEDVLPREGAKMAGYDVSLCSAVETIDGTLNSGSKTWAYMQRHNPE